jgi:hypothetical protein
MCREFVLAEIVAKAKGKTVFKPKFCPLLQEVDFFHFLCAKMLLFKVKMALIWPNLKV